MYITVYTHTVKRRATGRKQTIGCAYRTKSLTDMHAHIRSTHSDAETYKDPVEVITDFIPGLNLGCLPIVRGGTRIA